MVKAPDPPTQASQSPAPIAPVALSASGVSPPLGSSATDPGPTPDAKSVSTSGPDQQGQAQAQQSPPPDASNQPADPEETRLQLKQAITGSNQILATATTLIPVFADTITLDRAKLTLTKRTFFYTAQVMSIRIEDILNVTATVGPVFGSVSITSRVFNNQKPYTVNYFSRDKALHLKRVTQGYVIALQRDIDCSALPTKELSKLLDQLGEDDHPGASA